MFKLVVASCLLAAAFAIPADYLISETIDEVVPKVEQDVVLPFVDSSVKAEFSAVNDAVAPEVPAGAAYAYATDFAVAGSLTNLQCLKKGGYQTVFVRAFNPSGKGSFDSNAVNTIRNAYSAGLGIEVYMTPQPYGKGGAGAGWQQFDTMYKGLTSNGITVRSVWIQVTSPANWPANSGSPTDFIQSILARARQYGISVGIYTNQYDWNQITNGWTNPGNDVMLWYWNVLGGGVNGETQPNFNDFRAFGPWSSPSVKQFAQVESVCSMTVNRDIYVVGIPALHRAMKEAGINSFFQNSDKIVVGNLSPIPQ